MVCISKCDRAAFNGKSVLAHKVDIWLLIIIRDFVFERHVVRCGSKNENKKDIRSKEMDYVLKYVTRFRFNS
jgi:hypothetical protein